MKRLLILVLLAACAPENQGPGAPPPVEQIPADSLAVLKPEKLAPRPPLSWETFYDPDRVLDSIRVRIGGRPLQTLAAEGDSEPVEAPGEDVDTVDINLDGRADLRQRTIRGATGNVLYRWWLFDPDSGRFVHSPEYSREIGAHTLDRERRRITTRSHGGHAGAIFEETTFEPRGRELVRVRSISQDFDPETERYIRRTGSHQDGGWVEQMDTFTLETLPRDEPS